MDGNSAGASSSSSSSSREAASRRSTRVISGATAAMTGNNDISSSGQSQGGYIQTRQKNYKDNRGYGFDEHCHVFKRRKEREVNASKEKKETVGVDGVVVVSNPASDNGGNINPIFIPSIIAHIGSFLPCSDLKRCRKVNRQWNEEFSKLLRVKGVVKLTSKSRVASYMSQFRHNPNFCQNFHFELPKTNDPETVRFLKKFGPFIKYFKLDFSAAGRTISAEEFYDLIFVKLPALEELSLVGSISGKDHFLPQGKRIEKDEKNEGKKTATSSNSPTRTGIEQVVPGPSRKTPITSCPTLPQLRHLEIFLYNPSGQNVSKYEFLIELLSCIPNLEKISVPKVPRMLSFGMPLLHTLITTEQLNFHKLEHLDMDIALYNGSIDILKSKGFPLKYLNAEINSTVSEDSLHSFLETYEKTLTTLQLKFPRSPVASSELRLSSSFQALQHLTLHGYKGSLNFLDQLNLQSFGLIDNAFTIALRRPNLIRSVEARFTYKMIWTDFTEESYCFDCLDSSDSQLLRKFSINFPHLTSLNLPHLNDFDLRIIYRNFAHSLQDLSMDNPLCTDFGITGITFPMISEISNMGRLYNPQVELDGYRTQPFIGSLKRLRKLEILTPNINMTDASVTYGIVFCENLKSLIFRNSPLTDIALRKLVDSMQLEYMETTMCANLRSSGVKYALEKMTKREMTFVWST